MKKLYLISVLFILFITNNAFSQPIVGGEIGWECKSNGNYKFFLKLYRDCGFIGIFPNTLSLTTNVNGMVINLSLQNNYPKELSPVCYTTSPSITCSAATIQGTGAVQEFLYTTDSLYPQGVVLSGIPPTNGWTFSGNLYTRAPSENIIAGFGYLLTAVMYPSPNQISGVCNDNSPAFAEPPKTIMCSGFPTTFSNFAQDKDGDVLEYSWGIPTDNSGSPLTFASNYSYNSPLPGAYQSANNIAASLDSSCGLISFKSVLSGAFLTKTNVASYRNGIKTAIVTREMQIVLQNCSTNSVPTLTSPLPNSSNPYIIEVFAGDLVSFSSSATDFQFNPNMSPQNVKIEAFGDQFGSFILQGPPMQSTMSATSGCLKPPCATLTPAPGPNNPVQAQFAVSTQFQWQTSNNHLGPNQQAKWYYFKISAIDDYCPFPAQKNMIIKVLVMPMFNQNINAKILKTELLNTNTDVKVTWEKCKDSVSLFNSYELFSSNSKNGPFVLIDSVLNLNDTNLIHQNSSAGNHEIFYFTKIKYAYNGAFYYSKNSDTIATKFIDIQVDTMHISVINGNLCQMSFILKNNSNITVDTVNIQLTVGGITKYEKYVGQLLPGQGIFYNFNPDTIPSSGSSLYCVEASCSNDYISANNTKCMVVGVGIENPEKANFLIKNIQPNPGSGKFFIPIESLKNETTILSIFNVQGKRVKILKMEIKPGSHNYEIDLEKEENGMYFYSIELDNEIFFGKIVIVK